MAHPYSKHRDAERKIAKERYAAGGGVKPPQGTVRALPIRDSAHLQRLLDRADDDAAMKRLMRRMDKQNLSTDSDTFRE